MLPKPAMKAISGALAVCGLMLVSGCYSSALDAASHIALEAANRAPGQAGRPAAHQQSAIDAYTIERCVQMVSANPPYFLTGSNLLEGTPILHNRCLNVAFVLHICYDGLKLLLLDEKTHERAWNKKGLRLACHDGKVNIAPDFRSRIIYTQEQRQKIRDDWNRAFKK